MDFYRGRISARKLWVLVQNLPPDSLTATLAHPRSERDEGEPAEGGPASSVTYLEDIPLAKSMADVGKFVNEVG